MLCYYSLKRLLMMDKIYFLDVIGICNVIKKFLRREVGRVVMWLEFLVSIYDFMDKLESVYGIL